MPTLPGMSQHTGVLMRSPASFKARRSTPVAIALALSALELFIPTAVQAAPLSLAQSPLVSSTTVAPNILVAVDDSGSMDYETLLPNDDGVMVWNDNIQAAWYQGAFLNTNQGQSRYIYLFPNGVNNCTARGCDARDRRVYPDGDRRNPNYAVPPIPYLGFMRSHTYNRAYFSPESSYESWRDPFGDIDPTNAPADPSIGQSRFNLTTDVRSFDAGRRFMVQPGMPLGGVSYTTGETECVDGPGRDTEFSFFPPFQRCRYGEQLNWMRAGDDETLYREQAIGIEYFPATFYRPQDEPLPESFGWDESAETIPGNGPSGAQNLVGYEIRPENFTSEPAYERAIENFANWFSYYRKRHLATRSGIAAAFGDINRARVGACTINDRRDIQLAEFEDEGERNRFFSDIYNIDFARAQGTPNRSALFHLGRQYETRQDLIVSPCQENFAILFTDGLNTETAVSGIGNVDANSAAAERYGMPFPGGAANTMADIAMRFYEDLNPAANIDGGRVPVPSGCDVAPGTLPNPALDCERDPHMSTLAITLGQQGTLYRNPDHPLIQDDPWNTWPDALDWPDENQPGQAQIDDLWHATINARGSLQNADTAESISDAFSSVLAEINQDTGSASGVAANGGALATDSTLFQSTFIAGEWTGELTAFEISANNLSSQVLWQASGQLPQDHNDREILSIDDDSRSNVLSNGVAFRYAALRSDLPENFSFLDLNYIRGDTSHETRNGGDLRNRRNTRLGDMVHSTPRYVGAPNSLRYPVAGQWSDLRYPNQRLAENQAASYRPGPGAEDDVFLNRYADRREMVYVGANDGMLHGFDAQTGEERMAYVPAGVFEHLDALTSPLYAHRYYVDGTPTSADALLNGEWRTALVGGLAGGGKSLYALDITDPELFSEDAPDRTVMWEASYPDMGLTYPTPEIVRTHAGNWAVMAANGYNSDTGRASLYMLDLSDGRLLAHIETGAGTFEDGSGRVLDNGLSSPTPVDIDGDFIVDYAYAGDLAGNLWKFDLTGDDPNEWSVRRLFTATSGEPLGQTQPITAAPVVGSHPYGMRYGVMVYFGTGKYLETGDSVPRSGIRNSVYGVVDHDVFTFNEARGPGQPLFSVQMAYNLTREALTSQSVDDFDDTSGQRVRAVSDNTVTYRRGELDTTRNRGWVLDLASDNGEKSVVAPERRGQTLGFSTIIPSTVSCLAENRGFYTVVDAATGGRTANSVFDLSGDRNIDAGDLIEVPSAVGETQKRQVAGIGISQGAPNQGRLLTDRGNGTDRLILPTSDGSLKQRDIDTGIPPDSRTSWRRVRR